MTSDRPALALPFKQSIKDEARRLGFILAGFATPDPPPHLAVFNDWLMQGRNAGMGYLGEARSRARRADPRIIMPECRSILALAAPYCDASHTPGVSGQEPGPTGKVAAYAWGDDYHLVFPERMKALVAFIERHIGDQVSSRWYTDTGPVLERDLAQRAGLGWIGRNTCLINPRHGSYFLLAEILLDVDIEPDAPFEKDHCGTCNRCISACPTHCILPDRTIDAGRCISYLTIELRDEIPAGLRPSLGNWVFGCDVCQTVCPWNRFASQEGDPAFATQGGCPEPALAEDLLLTTERFNLRFRRSPLRRAKARGYRRNVAVALGNIGGVGALPVLQEASNGDEPLVQGHAAWAIDQIKARGNPHE